MAGLFFFMPSAHATVQLNIGVDLVDASLKFLLDEHEITAAEVGAPMDLAVGDHELKVLRRELLIKHFKFRVNRGDNTALAMVELPVPPPPPVAHWRFEGNGDAVFADETKNAAVQTVGEVMVGAGAAGQGAEFLEAGGILNVADSPALRFRDALTVAAWVRPAAAAAADVVARWQGAPSYSLTWDGDEYVFSLAMSDAERPITVRVAGWGVANRWTHVAGVFDGRRVTLLLDGEVVNVQRLDRSMQLRDTDEFRKFATVPAKLSEVADVTTIGQGLVGAIDEVQLWNVALQPEQIAKLIENVKPHAHAVPSGPTPMTATAKLTSDRLFVQFAVKKWVPEMRTKEVTTTLPDGGQAVKTETYVVAKPVYETRTAETAAGEFSIATVDGRPMDAAAVAQTLSKLAPVLLARDRRPLDPQYVGLYRPDLLLVTLRQTPVQDLEPYFGSPHFGPWSQPPMPPDPAPAAPAAPGAPVRPAPSAAVSGVPLHLAAFQPAPVPLDAEPIYLDEHPRVAQARFEQGRLVLSEYDWRAVFEDKSEPTASNFVPHWLPRPAYTKLDLTEVKLVDRNGVAGDATAWASQLAAPATVLIFGPDSSVDPNMLKLFQPGVPCITAPYESAERVFPKPQRPALPEPMLARVEGPLLVLTRLMPEMRAKTESYEVSKPVYETLMETVEEKLPDGTTVAKTIPKTVQKMIYETNTRDIMYSLNRPQCQVFLRSEIVVETAAGPKLSPAEVEVQLTFDVPVLVATADDPALANSRRLLKPDSLIVVLPAGRALSDAFSFSPSGYDAMPMPPMPAPVAPPAPAAFNSAVPAPVPPPAAPVTPPAPAVPAPVPPPPTPAPISSAAPMPKNPTPAASPLPIVFEIPADVTKLTHLALNDRRDIGPPQLEKLKQARELQWLELYGTSVTDEGTKHLSDLPKLQTLLLGNSGISDDGLVHLAGLKGLKNLHIQKNPGITDRGIESLLGMADLEALNLFGTEVSDVGLARLHALKNLRHVNVLFTKMTPAGIAAAQQALPACHFGGGDGLPPEWNPSFMRGQRGPRVPPAPVDSDRRAAEWAIGLDAYIEIFGPRLGPPRFIGKFAEIPPSDSPFYVSTLWFDRNSKLTDDALAIFSSIELPQLKRLQISRREVSDVGLERLKNRLPGLEAMLIKESGVTDAGFQHLAAFPGLTNLQVPTAVTDQGLKEVGKLHNLQFLDLKGTKVTGAGLKHVSALTALESLDLGSTSITDSGLLMIKSLGKLQELKLSQTKVTDAGVATLQQALPNCKIEWDHGVSGSPRPQMPGARAAPPAAAPRAPFTPTAPATPVAKPVEIEIPEMFRDPPKPNATATATATPAALAAPQAATPSLEE